MLLNSQSKAPHEPECRSIHDLHSSEEVLTVLSYSRADLAASFVPNSIHAFRLPSVPASLTAVTSPQ